MHIYMPTTYLRARLPVSNKIMEFSCALTPFSSLSLSLDVYNVQKRANLCLVKKLSTKKSIFKCEARLKDSHEIF